MNNIRNGEAKYLSATVFDSAKVFWGGVHTEQFEPVFRNYEIDRSKSLFSWINICTKLENEKPYFYVLWS